jgi:hypothetical protein
MVIMSNADSFKQAHELASGDKIALNYGEPFATVVQKITGDNQTVVIIEVPNNKPVRYKSE